MPIPLTRPTELLRRFSAPDADLEAALAGTYGDAAHGRHRCCRVIEALERFHELYGDVPAAVLRAPSRISLNPHSDHQGAWVPYGTHARELLAIAAPVPGDEVHIGNVDPVFEPELVFSVGEEIDRARSEWESGWLPYLEAPAVTDAVRENIDPRGRIAGRRGTVNYVKAGVLRMAHAQNGHVPGLRLVLHGDIPPGGGLSSSSAVVVTAALAATELSGAAMPRRQLAEMCGEAEWYVGTRGGSGDHAAMLLGSREGLVHLRFQAPFGVRAVEHSPFPAGYQLILANSGVRSEKSAEEKRLFNGGIFAYRFAYLALKDAMEALDFPTGLIEGTSCLGDLHAGRLELPDLYRLIRQVPEHADPASLAGRYPAQFKTSARACFGTDRPEELPDRIPLRGAAVYGLARVDRGWAMPGLLAQGSKAAMAEFGRLMSVTHDGDRLYRTGSECHHARGRLSDERLAAALDEARPLREEPGFYGASIKELDRMVDIALETEGVIGAGLMGAGGGGYVLIMARSCSLDRVRAALDREYYAPAGKEPQVEAWQPVAPAGRLA